MITFSTTETLNKIISLITAGERGAYMRYGDGDINIAYNENDLYNKANPTFAKEMQESLSISDKNYLKCLPLMCEKYNMLEPGMCPGNHECPEDWCDNILSRAKKYGDFTTVYSHIALTYAACYNHLLLMKLVRTLKNNKILFVGNKDCDPNILKDIFGEGYTWIKTPNRDSYRQIDLIYASCKEYFNDEKNNGECHLRSDPNREYIVTVVCMGVAGRPLVTRLWNEAFNTFYFDFSSLMDALHGWNTRAWINLSGFDRNKVMECIRMC